MTSFPKALLPAKRGIYNAQRVIRRLKEANRAGKKKTTPCGVACFPSLCDSIEKTSLAAGVVSALPNALTCYILKIIDTDNRKELIYIYIYICVCMYDARKGGFFMAGKMCPNCGQQTFFLSPTGRTCSKCGYEMTVPANNGKGGRGQKCAACDKLTVFNSVCRNCGATYSNPKD